MERSDHQRRRTILAVLVTAVAVLVGSALVATAMRVGEVTIGSEGSTTTSITASTSAIAAQISAASSSVTTSPASVATGGEVSLADVFAAADSVVDSVVATDETGPVRTGPRQVVTAGQARA